MPAATDYGQGLTIPDHIKSTLKRQTIKILEADGHGISFTSVISIQMRYIFNGQDLGGSYPISRYNNDYEATLLRAMADNISCRRNYPNGCRTLSPDKGVTFVERVRDRGGAIYTAFGWSVHYKKNGKSNFREFYCGTDNTMTTQRKKHAEAAAWHFRALYCENGDADVLSAENIKDWQHKEFNGVRRDT